MTYLWLLIDWSTAGWIMILVVDRQALKARLDRTDRHCTAGNIITAAVEVERKEQVKVCAFKLVGESVDTCLKQNGPNLAGSK